MKKSNYVAMMLSVLATLCLGIGMCMCLLNEWGLFEQGVMVGSIGIVLFLMMIFIYRKMEHKPAIRFSMKNLGFLFMGIIGVVAFGCGMSLTMVFNELWIGIVIGVIGILMLVSIPPLYKGLS